jgi:hypothetical protein
VTLVKLLRAGELGTVGCSMSWRDAVHPLLGEITVKTIGARSTLIGRPDSSASRSAQLYHEANLNGSPFEQAHPLLNNGNQSAAVQRVPDPRAIKERQKCIKPRTAFLRSISLRKPRFTPRVLRLERSSSSRSKADNHASSAGPVRATGLNLAKLARLLMTVRGRGRNVEWHGSLPGLC